MPRPGVPYYRVRGIKNKRNNSEWRQVQGLKRAKEQARWLLGMGYQEVVIEKVHITYEYEIVEVLHASDNV